MKPLNCNVLVRPDERESHVGEIIIPEAHQKRAQSGTVIEVGPNCTEVQRGNKVFYHPFSGKDVKFDEYDNVPMLIMGEEEIYMVVEE